MRRGAVAKFKTEAELVAAFVDGVERINRVYADKPNDPMRWTVYAETAGFDVLLVQDCSGVQIGIEAKLSLNLKALDQVLPGRHDFTWARPHKGPDYRAVLVPQGFVQSYLGRIAQLLGVTILTVYNQRWDPMTDDPDFKPWPGWKPTPPEWSWQPKLPDETDEGSWGLHGDNWMPWCPEERLTLPEYVPDVPGGVKSPVTLSVWKIKAIKLLLILERRGYVTRADMRFLQISPTIWTQTYLIPGDARGQYVSCRHTPDYRKVHARVWGEIEQDIEIWADGLELD